MTTKGKIKQQVRNLIEIRKKQREDFFKLFIVPLDNTIKVMQKYLRGQVSISEVEYHNKRCSERIKEALEVVK